MVPRELVLVPVLQRVSQLEESMPRLSRRRLPLYLGQSNRPAGKIIHLPGDPKYPNPTSLPVPTISARLLLVACPDLL